MRKPLSAVAPTAAPAKTTPPAKKSPPPAPPHFVERGEEKSIPTLLPSPFPNGEGLGVGAVWRLSSRHAVAYLRDAALAGELLAAEPRHLAKAAMAVYYDRKGKAFAWQVRFDAARWEEVVRRLG